MSRLYYGYWAKTAREPDQSGYHLLPYRLLDVAACVVKLLEMDARLSRRLSELLHIPPDELIPCVGYLMALHDLGKFSESFQNLTPGLFFELRGRNGTLGYDTRHDTLGWVLWDSELLPNLNFPKLWAEAIFGHHGKPVEHTRDGQYANYYFKADGIEAAKQYLDDLPVQLKVDTSSLPKQIEAGSWALAGFAVLADWLGSDRNFFEFRKEHIPLEEYWSHALECAKKKIENSGVISSSNRHPTQVPNSIDFGFVLSPLQQWAQSAEITNEPSLFILEDLTGAGKTEASVILAKRLLDAGTVDGLFFALPTMATANAMYGRIASLCKDILPDASLTLAHGKNKFNDAFTSTIETAKTGTDSYANADDDNGGAWCSEWLSDSRKKCFLADIGVGTIDQTLMSVLQCKYQSLRLIGLFRKVLIVDEVHANDAYMHTILRTVLKFHAALGGSVILLSATLPKRMKDELLASFHEGRQQALTGSSSTKRSNAVLAQQQEDSNYPLATVLHGDTVVKHAIAPRAGLPRTVRFRFVHTIEEVYAIIREHTDRAVCWIRNSVDDAIESFTELRSRNEFLDTKLFHARFAMCDRLRIEGAVLKRFGKESTSDMRQSSLLVATQVVEQSLDLDFDVLVTDLCPMDLLIQRAGRLKRHTRDEDGNRIDGADRRGEPEVIVFAPSLEGEILADWYSHVFKNGSFVYPNHSELWKTATVLSEKGSLRFPEDLRNAIERVFGDDSDLETPADLQTSENKAKGEASSKRSIAKNSILWVGDGYGQTERQWVDDKITATRLGDKTITLRLAKWKEGRLVPYSEGGDYPWEMSEVSVAAYRMDGIAFDDATAEAIRNAEAEMPDRGKWSETIPLSQETQGTFEEAFSTKLIRYSAVAGFQIFKK